MIGGSDAHTLRRVGTTWTEAPGATRAQFLDSLKRGLGRPGGAHGGTAPVAGDAYGVVARYVAALAGCGPQDVRSWRRAACLAFAAVSLPFQFSPLLVAMARKSAERRIVREVTAALGDREANVPASALRAFLLRPPGYGGHVGDTAREAGPRFPSSELSSPEPRALHLRCSAATADKPSPESEAPAGASS
jgi:hypothetical protein